MNTKKQIELINTDGKIHYAMVVKNKGKLQLRLRHENCNSGINIDMTDANRQKINGLTSSECSICGKVIEIKEMCQSCNSKHGW